MFSALACVCGSCYREKVLTTTKDISKSFQISKYSTPLVDPFKYERRGDQDVWEPRELRVPDWCPSDTLRKLIEECWHPDPNMRPSFSKLLAQHTFPRILLEAEISDPKARDFWGKYFLVETAVRALSLRTFIGSQILFQRAFKL